MVFQILGIIFCCLVGIYCYNNICAHSPGGGQAFVLFVGSFCIIVTFVFFMLHLFNVAEQESKMKLAVSIIFFLLMSPQITVFTSIHPCHRSQYTYLEESAVLWSAIHLCHCPFTISKCVNEIFAGVYIHVHSNNPVFDCLVC